MRTDLFTKEEHGFAWIDLFEPSKEELLDAGLMYELPLELVSNCLDASQLPKYEEHGFTRFIMLRRFQCTNTNDALTVEDVTDKTAIFMNDDFLITVHESGWYHMLKIRDSLSAELKRNTDLRNAPVEQIQFEVIDRIMEHDIESFDKPMDVFEERFEHAEEMVFAHSANSQVLRECYHLKRQLFVCHRALRLNLDVVRKMESSLNLWQNDYTPQNKKRLEYMRADGERFLSQIDTEIASVHNLLTLHMSFQSSNTNEIMRVLAVFSAFFMPLTFIAGVYGMNFEHMPELKSPLGYYGVLLGMCAVSLGIYIYFRKKKWVGRKARASLYIPEDCASIVNSSGQQKPSEHPQSGHVPKKNAA